MKTLSVVMAASDAERFVTDLQQGTKIHLLALDEFSVVDGVNPSTGTSFPKDIVESFQFVSGSNKQLVDATFSYTKFEIIPGDGSGGGGGDGGSTVPEPSSVALLSSGLLLGLIGFGRKKQATGGGGRPDCCDL